MRSTRHRLRAALLALLALAVFVPFAASNVPAPITKTNVVRDEAKGGVAGGTLTTKVTYTDTAATAVSSTGNTIGLDKGFYFRLRTCVAYRLHAETPVSSCAERNVDTRSNTARVYEYAPRVTLPEAPRPTNQPWGYFTAYTDVFYREKGAWLISAHSWPDNGLQGAGIAVAPEGQESGTLPANAAVTLDGPFSGAINSGEPDSICTETPVTSDSSALPGGVSRSHPAFSGAPASYEVGVPTGAYAGQAPRGVMLIMHGGGWAVTGAGAVEWMRPDADRWRARGWETVNLTYRACGQSAEDVLWFYDRARAWFGRDAKICALGTSAGGHLALLIGAYRPDLYCAVNQAGPTDLRTIQTQVAYDKASGQHTQTNGGRSVHNLAAAVFGEENLPRYSPAAHAYPTLKSTRVLQALSADDPLVPYQQAADLASAMGIANPLAHVDNIQLAAGTIPFGHGVVSQDALDTFYARETELVTAASAPSVTLSKR